MGSNIKEKLDAEYDQIMAQLVRMVDEADKWLIRTNKNETEKR